MKLLSITLIILMASCSSSSRRELEAFEETRVCSGNSLRYYKSKKLTTDRKRKSGEAQIQQEMAKLQPLIQQCYEEELLRTQRDIEFHLCFIAGFDRRGRWDYYQFSSDEKDLTAAMKYCLEDLRKKVRVKLRNVKILQPFTLVLKKKNES